MCSICLSLLLLALITLSSDLRAEPTLTDTLLAAYIREAWKQHPDLNAMRSMVAAESSRAIMSGGWMNPELRAGLMNVPEDLRTNRDPMTMLQVGMMQRITWPGKRKNQVAAGQAKESAVESGAQVERFEMAAMIAMLYYELAAAEEVRERLVQGGQLANEMREAATVMAAAGMESQAAVRRAQLEVEEWRLKQADNLTDISRRRVLLNSALGRAHFDSVSRVQLPRNLPTETLPSLESVRAWIVESPAVRQARFEVEAAHHEVQRAKMDYWPDLDVMLAFGIRRDLLTNGVDPHTGAVVEKTKKQDNMVSLEVAIPLPLFYRRNQRAGIAEMKAMQRKQEYEAEAIELTKKRDLEDLRLRYDQIRNRYFILKESALPQSGMVWQATLADYRAGKAGFMELSAARMKTVMTEMELVMLRAEAWTAWCQYYFTLGHALGISMETN